MRYDADLNDPLAALRIPVTDILPERGYLATLDRGGARPDDAEAVLLANYIDYQRQRWFTEHYGRLMLTKPFDVPEDGHNTVTFHKYDHGGWGYRRMWTERMLFFPPPYQDPMTLTTLLDRLDSDGGPLTRDWSKWKARHPKVFP